MNEETWSVEDDAAFDLATKDEAHPTYVAMAFMSVIEAPAAYVEQLRSIVTPESVADWADFSAASGFVDSIDSWGVGSVPTAAEGARDVAYIKILRDVPETYQQDVDEVVSVPGVLTLVWRPEFGRWLIHGLGGYISPDSVPRTSPGVAPNY